MATRLISSTASREDFEELVGKVGDSGDQIVLEVDGTAVGKVVPLTDWDHGELLRQAFAPFWAEHTAHQRENPPDLTEDEAMELAVELVRQARRELRAEREGIARLRIGESDSDVP